MPVQKPNVLQRASRLFWSCLPEKIRIAHRLRTLNRLYDAEIKQARRQGNWSKEQEGSSILAYHDQMPKSAAR
jgi:hypothetical protein